MSILASDERIIFGGNNSLYSFYPDEVNGNPFPPRVVISGLQINGERYNLGNQKSNKFNLSYDQNDVSIQYVGIHNSKSSKNKYQYRLHPYDRNWIDADNQRTARYASLKPGAYKFQAKAANNDGVWSSEEVSPSFIIASPWWQKWWAYSLLAVFISGVLFSLCRFQLYRKLSQQEAERLKELATFRIRFYANITHEFRTPLTIIEGMANELGDNPDKAPKKNLALIKKNSRGLLALVNQMLDLSKLKEGKIVANPQQDDVLLFITYLVETNESYANLKNVGLQFYSDENEIWTDFNVQKLE
ncbi:MAG: signal transduction histidine kinase [Saprospiraceae bacterium]|jgi:signal transduction histidine kinase